MKISELQKENHDVFYKKDKKRGIAGTFMYLSEEIGELAEALREPEKHDLKGEFADCIAWLTSLANLAEIDLEKALLEKYGKNCPKCNNKPCECETKP